MTDFEKFGRRGRPQREIYTPGSGPLLRKGGQDDTPSQSEGFFNSWNNRVSTSDRSAEISKVTDKLKKISMTSNENEDNKNIDSSKKIRKPDYAIYVPKRVAEAHASRYREKEVISCEQKPSDVSQNIPVRNERKPTDRNKKRDKRKKGRNSNFEGDKSSEKSLTTSQPFKSRELLYGEERDSAPVTTYVRHGSEPRSLMQQESHVKDLRNPDSWTSDKNRSKPPHGRRGSLCKGNVKPLPPSFESLPPRLQKKYIAENGLQDIDRLSYVGNTNETVSWDGSSVTFKGKSLVSNDYNRSAESSSVNRSAKSLTEWSKTLPSAGRAKGRGRLFRENYAEVHEPLRYSRSLTPETVHSSQFENVPEELSEKNQFLAPQIYNCNKNSVLSSKQNDEFNLRLTKQENCLSFDKKNDYPEPDQSNDTVKQTDTSDAENKLDWAAEVERCEQQDTIQLSDCKGSFVQPAPPPPKEKKKRRKGYFQF